MKIKIHKGTNEIGGSCIELKTKNTTILLDYGTPLQDTSKQVKITDNIDAILISHPHQDHFGEIVNIENSTPIYCGELSVELMNAAKIFTGNEILENNFQIFEAWKSFEIGDFKITPYLVDHSATDAYAFLIEADGKKVLYSGDFRANGRKSKLFNKMINDKNLKDLDILLMEGTMLQRSNKDFPDEQSVEDKIFETIKEKNQISFMIGSSQNIDSIVSAYRACKKANKTFVVDMYTAWILEKMKIISSNIPNIAWNDVKVIKKFGGSYYQKLQENKEYFKGFTSKIFDNVIEIDDIKANPQNYFLKISPWHIDKVLNYIEIETSNIIYSQWLGYLKEEFSNIDTVELFKNLQENNNWVYAHTSGHADLPALQKFASSLKPKILIPIHTEFKDKFAGYFENVMILEDGESFDISKNELSTYQVDELNELFKKDLGEYKMEFNRTKGIENLLENLIKEDLYIKCLEKDIKNTKVFMAFRSGVIDFYYGGSKIYSYTNNQFLSHRKFCINADIKDEYINQDNLNLLNIITCPIQNYKFIKDNAKKYGGVEDQGISNLFNQDCFSQKDIFLLDIEIALENGRIDILLYDNNTSTLKFVEAKDYSNKELWSTIGTKPEVIGQIKRYNKDLENFNDEILNEYQKYINILNKYFPLKINEPKTIVKDTSLYMFGFDQNQKTKIENSLKGDNSLENISYYFIGNAKKIKVKELFEKA